MGEGGKGAILAIDLYQRGEDKSLDYQDIKEIKKEYAIGEEAKVEF